MKRLISGILLLTMLVSLFAGCGGKEPAPETTGAPVAEAEFDANLADAVAYVKTIYKEVAELTAADYQRVGVIPMGGINYEIQWSANVSEDLIKIVKNADGMVTIDVNEESEEEVPYVLTATLTGTDGRQESLSWNHILPKAVGDDMAAIVGMAYALEDGQSLDFEATLTGTVNSINTPWSEDYQNITVTMLVQGLEDKPIMCYRLKGEGAKDLAIGDRITVTGILKNYKGTIEFDAGCNLDKVEAGAGSVAQGPTDPAEILEAAYGLAEGQALPYNSTLTGKIIRVDTAWSSQYKNITVTMVVEGHEDKPIMCYRLKGEGAEHLYADDVITVTGVLKNYYGTIEFDAGCMLVDVVPSPRIERTFAEQPKDNLKIMQDAAKLQSGHFLPYNVLVTGVVTEVNSPWSSRYGNITVTIELPGAEGYPLECFRMVGKQNGADKIQVGDTITVHGSITNYYGKTELAAGCWCYKVVKGEGNIVIESQFGKDMEEAAKLSNNEKLDRESTITGVITDNPAQSSYAGSENCYRFWVKDEYNNTVQCYYVPVEGGVPAKGDTVKVTGYLSAYNGQGQFYQDNAKAVLIEKAPEDTTPTEPTEPAEPDPTPDTTLSIPEAIKLGKSKDHNTYTTGKYYVKGIVQEITDTAYGNMLIKDAAGNVLTIYGTYSEDGAARFDNLKNPPKAGDQITVYGIIGQYNDTPQMKNGRIQGALANDPEDPDGTVLTIAQANEKGKAQSSYTVTKYKVTGVVDEIKSTTFGNLYIKDASGNRLYIYGLYDATGANRYDAMSSKPVVGDTITVYGVLGQYKGDAQMKNGWVVDHISVGGGDEEPTPSEPTPSEPTPSEPTPSEPTPSEPTPSEPEDPAADTYLSIKDAAALGASKDHGTYTEGKYYVTGTITGFGKNGTKYGNVYIADANGNSIYVYGMYSSNGAVRYDAMEVKPVEGDTITVYGVIGQYNSSAQMKDVWLIAHTPATPSEPEEPETLGPDSSIQEIIDALRAGKTIDFLYTITGKVSKAYDPSNGTRNAVVSASGQTVNCNKIANNGADWEALTSGDTVTITGEPYLNSNDKFCLGSCTLVSRTPAPTVEEPAAGKITVTDAVNLAANAYPGFTSNNTYTIEATITAINEKYGNITITDGTSSFTTYGIDGWKNMEVKPVVGDTITISGKVQNYDGKCQMYYPTLVSIS